MTTGPLHIILLHVALGGALGAVLRFGVVALSARALPEFPAGTMLVNVTGSFAMGLAAAWLVRDGMPQPFVMTGVLGAFTTFSAFSLDAVRLWEAGRVLAAGAYVSGSVVLCILALFAGLMLGRGALS